MQRKYSLKKSSQFAYVRRRGASQSDHRVVLIYLRGRYLKVGYSVSKKLGNAVFRNRVKRLMRESVRPLLGRLKKGSYILIARQGAKGAQYADISRSITRLLGRAGLLGDENGS